MQPSQTRSPGLQGVAIREFLLPPDHGFADYLLYVDGKAAGVIEAKQEGSGECKRGPRFSYFLK